MELHIINADKALYYIEIYRNCIKIHQNDQAQKDAKKHQKFDFGIEPKILTLLPTCF